MTTKLDCGSGGSVGPRNARYVYRIAVQYSGAYTDFGIGVPDLCPARSRCRWELPVFAASVTVRTTEQCLGCKQTKVGGAQ
jgi:hypothetical protein